MEKFVERTMKIILVRESYIRSLGHSTPVLGTQTVEMGFGRWWMRRSSAQRFDPKRKKTPRGSSYNQQQVALGDAAASLGAAALGLPVLLMPPTDEARDCRRHDCPGLAVPVTPCWVCCCALGSGALVS